MLYILPLASPAAAAAAAAADLLLLLSARHTYTGVPEFLLGSVAIPLLLIGLCWVPSFPVPSSPFSAVACPLDGSSILQQ